MKVHDLFEAPLPDSWDKDIYNQNIPFKTRLMYAKERAEQLGRGSSRVAFKIPYQGRNTALKIAINRKGAAQNEEEARMLEDWYGKSIGILIPMIDYDEESSYPTWIHTEYASKLSQKQLERYFEGIPMSTITGHLDMLQNRNRFGVKELPEEIHENDNFIALQDLVLNFGIPAGDFSRAANWGLYQNRPVIIDVGFNDETAKLYR